MYNESNIKQPLVQNEGATLLINFDELEIQRESHDGGESFTLYTYEAVRVPNNADYATIVTAIIREKYTADDVEAIILNGIEDEMAELQMWRVKAKQVAHQVLEIA